MRKIAPAVVVAATILLTLLPLFGGTFRVEQMTRILIYVILAASLDLMIGYTGLVNMGHAAFFGIAAYSAAVLADKWGMANVFIGLPLSLAAAAIASLIVGMVTVRLSGIYFIMATLAFTQIVFFLIHDGTWAGGSDGLLVTADIKAQIGGATLFDLGNLHQRYYITLAAAAIVLLGLFRLVDSPFGRALQGIRENQQRMRALGYRVNLYKLVSFVISGTLAGLAGYLYFALTNFADPTLTYWLQSAQIMVMTVLGGTGTLIGPALGAAFFTLFIDWSSELTDHWKLYLGIVVVAATLFAPGGFWNGLRYSIAKLLSIRRQREETSA
ncbi:MAG TPA: branched-chain amino acid ABC transporter permease [Hyphomicrobiales bacterium]|nr:branched-chain amino acid ABC transporter permease [Hyphomicrobiales bacterium]